MSACISAEQLFVKFRQREKEDPSRTRGPGLVPEREGDTAAG
jgi:hypothetical protein